MRIGVPRHNEGPRNSVDGRLEIAVDARGGPENPHVQGGQDLLGDGGGLPERKWFWQAGEICTRRFNDDSAAMAWGGVVAYQLIKVVSTSKVRSTVFTE